MQSVHHQLFSGAAVTGNQDRGLNVRKISDHGAYFLNALAAPDNAVDFLALLQSAFEAYQPGLIPDDHDRAAEPLFKIQQR